MAQIAQIPSGLESDTQRNEFSLGYVTNLEDQYPTAHRQDEYPTAYNVNPPYPAAAQEARPRGENWDGRLQEKLAGELKAKESRICGVKRLTFGLGLAVGVLVVVAAVGGGVLGSRIGKGSGSKRFVLTFPLYGRKIELFWQHTDSKARDLFSSQSSIFLSPSSALSSSLSTSHSATPTSNVFAALAQPSNDCAAFSTPYTADVSENLFKLKPSTNAIFDIYCRTDYVKGDFMSFYAPSLITCMNGCATFNYWQDFNGELAKKNCSGVVYGLLLVAHGNCYLKSGGYVTTMTRNEFGTYARLRSTFT